MLAASGFGANLSNTSVAPKGDKSEKSGGEKGAKWSKFDLAQLAIAVTINRQVIGRHVNRANDTAMLTLLLYKRIRNLPLLVKFDS